jgi:hypothetical protein
MELAERDREMRLPSVARESSPVFVDFRRRPELREDYRRRRQVPVLEPEALCVKTRDRTNSPRQLNSL